MEPRLKVIVAGGSLGGLIAGVLLHRVAAPQAQLSWDRIYQAFRKRLPVDRYILGKAVERIAMSAGAVSVTLADGTEDISDLVVGADGVGSVVRDAVAPGSPTYAGYAAWRGLYPETDLPLEAAQDLADRFAFYSHPRFQILGYLVAGADGSIDARRRRYNWVWYRPAHAGSELDAALTDMDGRRHEFSLAPGAMSASDVDRLRDDARRELPPQFADAVSAAASPFVQGIFDHQSVRMTQGRAVLLGDAAFVVRPHTAMGVAKAAGDALALVHHLTSTPALCDALQRYDAERRPEGEAIAAHGRRLGASLS